ncbi:MAG: hypothetical protein QM704_00545 [Anaeromyxobacteraceae bacterium]
MTAHTLSHPHRRACQADYGFDRFLGFFATVFVGGRVIAEYDRTRRGYDDLNGVLRFLVRHRFFEPAAVDAAIALAMTHDDDELPPEVRRVAEVIHNLRRGADPD